MANLLNDSKRQCFINLIQNYAFRQLMEAGAQSLLESGSLIDGDSLTGGLWPSTKTVMIILHRSPKKADLRNIRNTEMISSIHSRGRR